MTISTVDDGHTYMRGMCDAMALALHSMIPNSTLGLIGWVHHARPDEDGEPLFEAAHAVCVLSTDPLRYLDVLGLHEGIEGEFLSFGPSKGMELMLRPADIDEVENAFTTLDLSDDVARAAEWVLSHDLGKVVHELRARHSTCLGQAVRWTPDSF